MTPADLSIRSAQGSFDEVKERVLFALENRGLVVNYTARVGAMLERTGPDVGSTRRIYANAEVIEFCSATHSRATMEADPQLARADSTRPANGGGAWQACVASFSDGNITPDRRWNKSQLPCGLPSSASVNPSAAGR